MWQLLSYKGHVTETDIRKVADLCKERKCESGTDVGQCDQVKKWRAQNAKHALRRAKALQRRLEQGKVQKKKWDWHERKMLQDLRDGSLRATANRCVMEQGRGRLRGSRPGDYVDIGTNQEFSAVAEVLDGPQKRPRTDSFLHRRCF